MKISQKKKIKPIVSVAALLVAALIAGGALYASNTFPFKPSADEEAINYDDATDEQKDQGQKTKQNTIDAEKSESTESEATVSKSEPDSTTAPAQSENELRTVITAKDTDDQYLYIRSETEGIYAEGTCTLTLEKSDEFITKTTGVQALPQSTTCKGFNIPLSELSSGTYTLTLKVNAAGNQSITKEDVSV